MRSHALALVLVLVAACAAGGEAQDTLEGPAAGQEVAPPDRDTAPGPVLRVWQPPELLAEGTYRLETTGDDAGRVTAVWSRIVQPGAGLYAASYQPGTGWAPPVMLQATDEVGTVDVEAGRDGAAHALWISWAGRLYLYASHDDPAHGWSPVERLDVDDAAGVRHAALAVEPDGDAIAVWIVDNHPDYDLMARRYQAGVGWGPPAPVTTGPSHALTVDVVVDAYGNATALWWNLETLFIHAASSAPGTGWSAPVAVGHVREPALVRTAIDADGNLTAVWADPFTCIAAVRWTFLTGWSGTTCISSGIPYPNRVRIDGDRHGRVHAAWSQSELQTTSTGAWTNRFDGTAWAAPFPLEQLGSEYQLPDVGLDAHGGALAAWTQHDGTHALVRARRFTAASGWEATTDLVAQQDGLTDEARIEVSGAGAGHALWIGRTPQGDRSLWTARYE